MTVAPPAPSSLLPAAPAQRSDRPTGGPATSVVVRCPHLDLGCVARVRHELEQAHAQRPDRLVLELSDCRSLDMAGLAVLLEARRRTRARGGTMVLRGCSDRLRRLLAVSATGGLFELE